MRLIVVTMRKQTLLAATARVSTCFASVFFLASAQRGRAALLTYHGGPVIAAVKVVQVLWGSAGTFGPGIASGGKNTPSRLGDFYKAITNSPYLDWLSEYDTISPSQTIGRGTFAGMYTINPSKCPGGATCTVDDADIQAELSSQIGGGHLPAPDANTVYFLSFPQGVTVTFQGVGSCSVFCSYHNAVAGQSAKMRYAVLPDYAIGGCSGTACGAGATAFDNTTGQASGILDGMVTNPDGPLNAVGWYDNSNGEIESICYPGQGTIVGSDGVAYDVAKEWSNSRHECFIAVPYLVGDVNGDSKVDVADVFYLINHLFAGGQGPVGSGDVNGDGVVNVADVFYLVNYLFAGGPAPV